MPFQKGNSGRPKGSRNALGEVFYRRLKEQFEKHGVNALEKLAQDDPKGFLDICVRSLPKDVNVVIEDRRIEDMSLAELTAEARRVLAGTASGDGDATEGTDKSPSVH